MTPLWSPGETQLLAVLAMALGVLLVGLALNRHAQRGGGGRDCDGPMAGRDASLTPDTAPAARSFAASMLLPLDLPAWGLWALLGACAAVALFSAWRFRRAGCPRSGGWGLR